MSEDKIAAVTCSGKRSFVRIWFARSEREQERRRRLFEELALVLSRSEELVRRFFGAIQVINQDCSEVMPAIKFSRGVLVKPRRRVKFFRDGLPRVCVYARCSLGGSRVIVVIT